MARRKRKVSHEPPQLREWGGTPETERKARENKPTLEILWNSRRIDSEHVSAADEICWIFGYITGALRPRGMMLDRVDGARSFRTETESVALAHKINWIPWANELTRRQNMGGPPILPVTLDIAFFGFSGNDVDLTMRWRKGNAANYLIEGLEAYAIQARWIKR